MFVLDLLFSVGNNYAFYIGIFQFFFTTPPPIVRWVLGMNLDYE